MTGTTTIKRLGLTAVTTAVAGIALAAPASALQVEDPSGTPVPASHSTPVADDGWELSQVATGALAGIAIAGVGVVAVAGMRRHRHLAHPA